MRKVSQIHHADNMAAKGGATFGSTPVGDEISEGSREEMVQVRLLASRVADAKMRELASGMLDLAEAVMGAKSVVSSSHSVEQLGQLSGTIDARVTALLNPRPD